jgi:HEAT repeat protein
MAALRKDDRNYDLEDYENPDLRKAIIKVGEPAFQALVAALQQSDMLRAATKTLQLWGDSRAVEPLIAIMLDERVHVANRIYAIRALEGFRDPRAFQYLMISLWNKDLEIRSCAALALAEYGDPSIMPTICDALRIQGRRWLYMREGLPHIFQVLRKRSIENNREQEFNNHYSSVKSIVPEAAVKYEASERRLQESMAKYRNRQGQVVRKE